VPIRRNSFHKIQAFFSELIVPLERILLIRGGNPMKKRIVDKMAEQELPGNSSSLCVARANGEFCVYALEFIEAGQMFLQIMGEQRDRPSPSSIQVGWNLHLDVNGSTSLEELMDHSPWRFMNHSCDGNAMVQDNHLVAIRVIRPGEEITFNYNATEFEMVCPFTCRCGSLFCVREIRGFKYLKPKERERLRPLLNLHLKNFLDMPGTTVEHPVPL
jgi:hypothetical protein